MLKSNKKYKKEKKTKKRLIKRETAKSTLVPEERTMKKRIIKE